MKRNMLFSLCFLPLKQTNANALAIFIGAMKVEDKPKHDSHNPFQIYKGIEEKRSQKNRNPKRWQRVSKKFTKGIQYQTLKLMIFFLICHIIVWEEYNIKWRKIVWPFLYEKKPRVVTFYEKIITSYFFCDNNSALWFPISSKLHFLICFC